LSRTSYLNAAQKQQCSNFQFNAQLFSYTQTTSILSPQPYEVIYSVNSTPRTLLQSTCFLNKQKQGFSILKGTASHQTENLPTSEILYLSVL